MYGLIGKIISVNGRREELIGILGEEVAGMPGCLSYVIAKDTSDTNGIWVTEVWESKLKHEASLTLPTVQAAIQRARPLMAGMGERFETVPVGGYGI